MTETNLKNAILHIFASSFFRFVLFVCIVLSLLLLVIQEKIVFPLFHQMQLTNIETEAVRTAGHLRNSLHIQEQSDKFVITPSLQQELLEAMQHFSLIKIKIFDSKGLVVYSSESNDIGSINQNKYFHEIVAKGEVFAKIVEKNQVSMEGHAVPVSVAEVYVPNVCETNFLGAFEVYYDITDANNKITRNEHVFRATSFLTWLIMALVFAALFVKASLANISRSNAEELLTETNRDLEQNVQAKTREIKATQLVSMHALASLAEHYDEDTGHHLERIQEYVQVLLDKLSKPTCLYADYIRRNSHYIKEITVASLLHDIGKTAIPVEILIKPSALTEQEFGIVKTHTAIAGEALEQANDIFRKEFGKDSYLALARDIALYHHEKWNGTGYPLGLKGQDIPLSARIVAVADVYDALTGDRPYKTAWPHDKAFEEIVLGSGTHFDPVIVEAFTQCSEQFRVISTSGIKE